VRRKNREAQRAAEALRKILQKKERETIYYYDFHLVFDLI
jgi:hypothetical protein